MRTEITLTILAPREPSEEWDFWLDNENSELVITENASPYIAQYDKRGYLLTLKTTHPARPVALLEFQNSQIAIFRLHGAGKHIAQQFADPDGDGDFPVILILCEKSGKVVARTLDYAFQLPIYCQEILNRLMDELMSTAGESLKTGGHKT